MSEYPVVLTLPVRWGDMDALGHVNNTVYFRWFESARMAYMERVGIPLQPNGDVGPILAQTECSFLQPVTYPAEVRVGARVSSMGTTSFVMDYQVDVVGAGTAAKGLGVIVLLNYSSGKPTSIPEPIRQRIADFG
ncbi:MAG: acyl-CoA thioesterase [Actinobacteria bacterium]|nr:acyl-CoA thioesterase [Actinomycetota bacterium]